MITGFQNGETAAVLTKAPVLKTTATTASVGGLYPITASGGEASNYTFIYRQGTMVVESFAGNYEALLVDGAPPLPVGKLSPTVAATSKTFTGKLYTPTETAALSLLSTALTTNPSTELATGTVTVTKAGILYVVDITLPLQGDVLATVTKSGGPLGTANDGRKLSMQTVTYGGAHTAVLEPALPTEQHGARRCRLGDGEHQHQGRAHADGQAGRWRGLLLGVDAGCGQRPWLSLVRAALQDRDGHASGVLPRRSLPSETAPGDVR